MQLFFATVAVNRDSFAWFALGIVGAVGLLALLSPRRFSSLATRGGQWVDSNKVLTQFDKRVDIDAYVMPFSRSLGVAVLAAVVLVGYMISRY
ncbi:MAG: hypothetical protein HY288_02470 [Planctomycetia bacterium]|nr:hypothetical protein [Planctomycetia bacterium]